jgi:hypothetical protein
MAVTYITNQESPKYSENLLPKFCQFDENIVWNVVLGGSNAVVENTLTKPYKGKRCLLITAIDTGGITFDYASGMSFTATETGTYIIAIRAKVPVAYDGAIINFRMYCYKNSVSTPEFDFNVYNTADSFEYDKWNTFYQTFDLEVGDVFDVQFKHTSDTLGSTIYLDGFKVELDNRNVAIPSRYTKAEVIELFSTQTIDVPSISSNGSYTVVATLTGAEVGDFPEITYPAELITLGLVVGVPTVTDTDEISFIIHNHSGGSINPSSGTYTFKIVK